MITWLVVHERTVNFLHKNHLAKVRLVYFSNQHSGVSRVKHTINKRYCSIRYFFSHFVGKITGCCQFSRGRKLFVLRKSFSTFAKNNNALSNTCSRYVPGNVHTCFSFSTNASPFTYRMRSILLVGSTFSRLYHCHSEFWRMLFRKFSLAYSSVFCLMIGTNKTKDEFFNSTPCRHKSRFIFLRFRFVYVHVERHSIYAASKEYPNIFLAVYPTRFSINRKKKKQCKQYCSKTIVEENTFLWRQ